MYGMIRLLLGCLLFVCGVLLVRKSKAPNKKPLVFCSALVSILISVISAFVPFENLFLTFHFPDAAFEYYLPGTPSVEVMVQGTESDLLVDREGDEYILLAVPKTDSGWKVGIGMDLRLVSRKLTQDHIITVYRFRNTDDHYIAVHCAQPGSAEITDSCGTEFSGTENYNEVLDQTFYSYFGYLDGFEDSYVLTINGEGISLTVESQG